MSDEQFRRPGPGSDSEPFPSRPSEALWQPEFTPTVETVVPGRRARPTTLQLPNQPLRVRYALVLGVAGLLVGLVVGATLIGKPEPAPLEITLDTFPTEILGKQRDDIEWRTANSTPVVERLDAQFQEQLTSHRFAYGGEGAEFTYGDLYTLTIVNGRLATEVPSSDDSEQSVPTVVSLNSDDTSCVSTEEPLLELMMDEMALPRDPGVVVIDVGTGTENDPAAGTRYVWTECVLFDDERNLGLRLAGSGEGEDMLGMAGRFRDELVSVHSGLIS